MRQWSSEEKETIMAGLHKMLASVIFSSSPRQQRFLEYLVVNTLEGQAARLKGYTIAVDVFDRSESFDPSLDAIVRVEATRLRNKLREYYEKLGRDDAYVFELPKGGYNISISQSLPQTIRQPVANQSHEYAHIQASLAVLPFSNISDQPEQFYFADGITDTLITELSRLSGLLVISRHSSFAYRNSTKSMKEIGNELGVQHLLQGAVQKYGERMRVSVELVSVDNSISLWSERYDSELKDVFAMQDEIARAVAGALQIKLSGPEATRFGYAGTKNIEAHDILLRGIELFWQYIPKATAEAQLFFRQSIALDENYASAHAWLARSLTYDWIFRLNSHAEVLADAFTHAKRATELDPMLSFGHAVLGWVYSWRKEFEPALASVKKAVAIDPNNAEAYAFLAQILASAGYGEEGLSYIETALRLNPRSHPWYHHVLGQCYWVQEQYDKALQAWQYSKKMSPTFLPTQLYLCAIYAVLGDKEALETQREATLVLLADGVGARSHWFTAELEAKHRRVFLLTGIRLPDDDVYAKN